MSVQSTQGSRELCQAFGLTELFQPGAEVALSERLIEQAKRHARLLRRKDPSLNHADALESVANTAGFRSWHNLQSTSQALAEGRVKATAAIGDGAYPLLATVTDGLEGEAAGALFMYAFVLGALVGLPHSTVYLTLFFKGHYTSEPAEEEEDELTFHVLDTGEGSFWISEASHCRVERMMLLLDSLESATPEEREQLAQEFVEIYEADEGVNCRLFLAERFAAHLPDEDKRVINMLGEGLKQCMGLIPEDFRGTIPPFNISNQVFHRAIAVLIREQILKGSAEVALRLAEIQVCFEPTDTYGAKPLFEALREAPAGDRSAALEIISREQAD